MQIANYRNGHATLEKIEHNGYYSVRVYVGSNLHDKVTCDTRRIALEYWRAFKAIAKNA